MARITVEDCLTKETNRFALVLLAAKRTKQILNGSRSLLPEIKNKAVVTSLREIADGKVRFMTDEDIARAEEEKEAERRSKLAESEGPEDSDGSSSSDDGDSEASGASENGSGGA